MVIVVHHQVYVPSLEWEAVHCCMLGCPAPDAFGGNTKLDSLCSNVLHHCHCCCGRIPSVETGQVFLVLRSHHSTRWLCSALAGRLGTVACLYVLYLVVLIATPAAQHAVWPKPSPWQVANENLHRLPFPNLLRSLFATCKVDYCGHTDVLSSQDV